MPENIVYTYARSKDHAVRVGIRKLEYGFILGRNHTDYSYVQVAMTIMNSIDKEDRVYKPLEGIRDSFSKYLIAKNDLIQHRNGILHVYHCAVHEEKPVILIQRKQ